MDVTVALLLIESDEVAEWDTVSEDDDEIVGVGERV